VHRKAGDTKLLVTVEAASADLARIELENRLTGLGITPAELVDWTVGATVIRPVRRWPEGSLSE